MLDILVTILIIIGLLYLAIIIYQHLLLRKVRLVEKKNKNVQGQSLKKAILRTSRLTLSGQSLNNFNNYRKRYHQIHNQAFDVVDRLIQDIERDSRGLNFLRTRKEYQKANREVNGISLDIKDIRNGLKQLDQVTVFNRKAAVDLNRIYRKSHKDLLTKHYIYGPSVNQLQTNLRRIVHRYDQFVHLTRSGDHSHARRLLKGLRADTLSLQSDLKLVPVFYKNLASFYPKQINEIKHGYHYMIQSGYQFPEEDLDGAIQYVHSKIQRTVDLLRKINLGQVKNSCHQIENMIDQLYDALAREYDAKRKVDEDVDVVTEYIEHAQKQNYALAVELKRLAQNYDLTHHEITTTKQLRTKLARIDTIHQKDLDAMAENQVVYSVVLNHQVKAEHELGQIEAVQREINRSVYDLNREEARARKKIKRFGLDLHNVRRRIGHLNLPGLPKNYVDYYNLVFNETKRLYHKINQVKISMDDIRKRLVAIESDMEALRGKTRNLVEDAVLAEQLMQYSNRYRSSSQDIANASARAQHLFEREYRYRDSFRLIAQALHQVEPGAVKRIKNDYLKK